MKNLILTGAAIALATSLSAPANPRINSWFTDHSGGYARAYETTTDESALNAVTSWDHPVAGRAEQLTPTYSGIHEISSDATSVYIRTTGLASYVMGPWYLNAAKTNLFPNYPSNTASLYRFDLDPGTPPLNKTLTGLGAIGYFVDGVAMFDSRDAFSYVNLAGVDSSPANGLGQGDRIWNRDAYVNESVTFDAGNAHQAGPTYHYHANPPGLRHLLGDSVDYTAATNTYTENLNGLHSPILGWVRDSYPVYGPYGYDDPNDPGSGVRRMISGFQKRDGTNGSTDLTATGRTSLPQWAVDVQGIGPVLAAAQFGPAVTPGAGSQYELGHYIEDYDYRGDLGMTQGSDFDLDLHNGRLCVTPEFPGGTYAYFTSIEVDGTPSYPYNIGRTYYGNPTGGTAANIPGGATVHFEGGPEAEASLESLSVDDSSGDVELVFNVAEGGSYILESTGDLQTWQPFGSFKAASSLTSIPDPGRANLDDRRFYRALPNGLEPFDDAGFDYDSSPPDLGIFAATFPTDPALPLQGGVTSITIGGLTATIVSYDQFTGLVGLDFDRNSLAPGTYHAILTFTPSGGSETMINSTNTFVVKDRNNILLIIVDDWAIDSSPIDNNSTLNPGTTFPTMANLQALAAGGVRFTNGYSQPVCSPMRAAIMTGRQAWRTGVGNPGHPLLASETALPEAFTAAGAPYQLASYGKWHLGGGNTGYNTLGGWPEFVGITGGGVPDPDGYTNWPKNDNGTVTTGFTTYTTTDQVNEAKTFIDFQEAADNPWFVWMGFNAPHDPFHEPPAALLQGKTGTNNRALYEKALEALDTEIGRLLESVDLNTTNVFLVGDNGTPAQVVQAPFGPTGGAGHSKGDIYEGGIHVPFVASGPDVTLPAGSTSDRFVHVIDFYPTILELAGVPLPGTGVDAKSLVPILNGTDTASRCVITEKFNNTATFTNGDGRSLRMEADPAFPGSHPDYKLIIFGHPFDTSDTPTYEFYNVVTDQNEQSPLNLATLNATEQAAYDALIAKDAALGGGFSDPPTAVGDTLYLELPNITGPASPPNNQNVLPTSITIDDGSGTNQSANFVARVDQSETFMRYWVKCTLPPGISGTYSNAVVTFPPNPNNGAARVFTAIQIVGP